MNEINLEVPWGVGDVVRALIVLFIMIFPGFLFSLLPFSTGYLASSANSLLAAFVMTFMEGMLLFLAWFFGIRKYHTSFNKLGFYSYNIPRGLAQGVLWLIAIKVFTVIYGVIAMSLFRIKPPEELVKGIPDIFGSGTVGMVLAVVVVAFVAPIAEEAFFRGFIYPAFRKRFGVWAGIIISTIIFALFHARIWLMVPVVAMGIILAFLYEKEKSLGPPIILHSLNNLISLIIIYVQKG